MLTLEREELRRYSVWEQEELEDRGLRCKDEELPPAVLLFLVSETAAAAVQWDLHKLCVKQDGTTNTGETTKVHNTHMQSVPQTVILKGFWSCDPKGEGFLQHVYEGQYHGLYSEKCQSSRHCQMFPFLWFYSS